MRRNRIEIRSRVRSSGGRGTDRAGHPRGGDGDGGGGEIGGDYGGVEMGWYGALRWWVSVGGTGGRRGRRAMVGGLFAALVDGMARGAIRCVEFHVGGVVWCSVVWCSVVWRGKGDI